MYLPQFTHIVYSVTLMSLGTGLISSCSQSHQVGMDQDQSIEIEKILNSRLAKSDRELNTNDSIRLLHHCTQLGTEAAAPAAGKKVTLFMGNSGVGKSTALNALLGCRMQRVKSNEVYRTESTKRVIIVHPESTKREIMNIGHGGISRTFLPQIAEVPGHPNSAYCDCPGFFDNRGPEISIANAINNRKLLQQASGVNVVLLTNYNGLYNDRGASVTSLAKMCEEMFGSVENLQMYKNSVLLGITHAPYKDGYGEPITLQDIKDELSEAGEIASILAKRVFLFDPLDRCTDNSSFWYLEQLRTEIARLDTIPKNAAINLLQTALNNNDLNHLVRTKRNMSDAMVNSIKQINGPALSKQWELLELFSIIEYPEVKQLRDEVVNATQSEFSKMVDSFQKSSYQYEFASAQSKLEDIVRITNHFPGDENDPDARDLKETINKFIDGLRKQLNHDRTRYEEQQKLEAEQERLEAAKKELAAEIQADQQRFQSEIHRINERSWKLEAELEFERVRGMEDHMAMPPWEREERRMGRASRIGIDGDLGCIDHDPKKGCTIL